MSTAEEKIGNSKMFKSILTGYIDGALSRACEGLL